LEKPSFIVEEMGSVEGFVYPDTRNHPPSQNHPRKIGPRSEAALRHGKMWPLE
jgi:hypothetical protein